MHYLEDISAGKLLVLEHGRREGVEGGPEIVVEKEDFKETVRLQIMIKRWDNASVEQGHSTQEVTQNSGFHAPVPIYK